MISGHDSKEINESHELAGTFYLEMSNMWS